jgi:hypothetical protein
MPRSVRLRLDSSGGDSDGPTRTDLAVRRRCARPGTDPQLAASRRPPILDRFLIAEALGDRLRREDRRWRVPTTTALLLLVRNLLVCREPLYGVGEWAARHELALLGLSDEQLGALSAVRSTGSSTPTSPRWPSTSDQADLNSLLPDVWIAAHPEHLLKYRRDEAEVAATARRRPLRRANLAEPSLSP